MSAFSLPLVSGTASFSLPEDRSEETLAGLEPYPDLADEAYDLEDTDPEAALAAYDHAILGALYDLGAFGFGEMKGEGGLTLPAEDPAAPEAYDPLVVQDLAAMLYNRGGVRFDLDDLEGSLEDLDASHALAASAGVEGEELAEVLVRRAETKFALADVDGAFADLDAALAEDPEHGLAFNNRAVYRAELGQMDEAFDDVERAIETDGENALYQVTLAELHAGQGDDDAALTALETAIGLDPDATSLLDAEVFDGLRKQPRFAALGNG